MSLLSEIGGEMTIQFPKEYTALFKDFFTDFDNDLAGLGIQTYGISITTLEQVFLEIGHNPNPVPRILNESGIQRPGTATPGPDRGAKVPEGSHLEDLIQRGPHETKVTPIFIPADDSKALPLNTPLQDLVSRTPSKDGNPDSDRRLIGNDEP